MTKELGALEALELIWKHVYGKEHELDELRYYKEKIVEAALEELKEVKHALWIDIRNAGENENDTKAIDLLKRAINYRAKRMGELIRKHQKENKALKEELNKYKTSYINRLISQKDIDKAIAAIKESEDK